MITDPAAITFSNEQARRVADQMGRFYNMAKEMLELWNGTDDITSVAPKILNENTVLDDGSAKDGRSPVTGADINNLVMVAQEFVSNYEASQYAVLSSVLKVAVNPE